jgi:arylsulfatase A-like enzyme
MDTNENRTSRRIFLRNMGLAAAAGAIHAQETKRPNILLILADDLGFGDLACCGAKDMRTPHLDALFASGMRFDQFHANCTVCSPTRAALLTGCYPDKVGVPGVIRTHSENSWGFLNPDAILLPRLLGEAGYRCGMVGKWHLGLESPNTPTERGFDHFQGYLGDMMDDYYTHRRHDINYMRAGTKEIDPKGHATDLFSEWASDYIRANADSEKPFFLYLAYNAPHTPIQPPQDWLKKVQAREPGIDEKRAKLVALIEHMDHGVGQVLQTLKETGAADNTLIIFTSDNGGQSNVGANNGGLRGGKQDHLQGGLRVPTCVAWPERIAPGAESDHIALTMDLLPTLCTLSNATTPSTIDGEDFSTHLLGAPAPTTERTLFWVRREGGHYGGRAYYAARRGPWKLLQNTAFEPMKLYNLDDDPGERNPLPTSHRMYKQLFQALRNHIIESGSVPWREPR